MPPAYLQDFINHTLHDDLHDYCSAYLDDVKRRPPLPCADANDSTGTRSQELFAAQEIQSGELSLLTNLIGITRPCTVATT